MAKAYSYLRISTKEQSLGDGIERQLAASRKWATDNGLIIDEELADIGKSGYHSAHIKDGALGAFLELVEKGKIPPGSVLLVESLDRLSRANPLTAIGQLTSLLNARIDVVTLIDNQRYSFGRDYTQLIVSLTIMSRSFEESETKSIRIKASLARAKNDALAGKKTFVQNCPKWIIQERQRDGSYKFALDKEKAAVVRRIFELYLGGLGTNSVSRVLNEEGVKTFKSTTVLLDPVTEQPILDAEGNKTYRRGIWTDSVVRHILLNEVAIGSYKVADSVIENYFPSAVPDTLFWKVQDRFKARPNQARVGQKGETFTNLFGGMARCHHCDGVITTKRSGNNNQYLYFQCKTKFLGGKCERVSPSKLVKLPAIEKAILDNVIEYHAIADESSSIEGLKAERALIVSDIEKYEKNIKNLNLMATTADNEEDVVGYVTQVNTIRKEVRSLNAKREELDRLLREASEKKSSANDINNAIVDAINKWPTLPADQLFLSRANVSEMLSKIVTQIRIDFDNKQVIVIVGGMTKGWLISEAGEVVGGFDWSKLPWSVIQARTAQFFGLNAAKMKVAQSFNEGLEVERFPESMFMEWQKQA